MEIDNVEQARDVVRDVETARNVVDEVETQDAGTSKTNRKRKREERKIKEKMWNSLEHKGPVFAPPFKALPLNVRFFYDGQDIALSEIPEKNSNCSSQEVASFYAKMLNRGQYTTKSKFNDNFFEDWQQVMTREERNVIKDLTKCDFKQMQKHFQKLSQENKNRTKLEKQIAKKNVEKIEKEYGYCIIDGFRERIRNFNIEPPGLFQPRGEHPKMGKLKRRVMSEDITINCSENSNVPVPPLGQKPWKIIHNNTVTWLASWTENIEGKVKYVILDKSSKLKGEIDKEKYEIARKLQYFINEVRDNYRADWDAEDIQIRQRAVALYFIDRFALRAGNEKDDDQADTVGCCSLRVEQIELHKEKEGKEFVVVFDFLGKHSIRYYNEVPVEKRVFENLELFKQGKKTGDDLFDKINPQALNEHLKDLMPGLTTKVFRTYNACTTLQSELDKLTIVDATIPVKIHAYRVANYTVAVLCNHKKTVPKDKKFRIKAKRDLQQALEDLKTPNIKSSMQKATTSDKDKNSLNQLRRRLNKLLSECDRDESLAFSPESSKLNYLDPRITVAWCKKQNVPISEIFSKYQMRIFRNAINTTNSDYVF